MTEKITWVLGETEKTEKIYPTQTKSEKQQAETVQSLVQMIGGEKNLLEINKQSQFLDKLKNRKELLLEDITPKKYYKGFKDFKIIGEKEGLLGYAEIILRKDKTIFIRGIEIKNPNFRSKGYGKSIYKHIQETHLDYIVVSDPDTMDVKTNENQEKSDAVYMWDSLVKEGLAIKSAEKNYRFQNPFVTENFLPEK